MSKETILGYVILFISFIVGWLLGGLYKSLRGKWFANKLEKKWGKMKDMTISPNVENKIDEGERWVGKY